MYKLVELSRAKIKEGRREPRTQKELLVYLIYIEMLGHDTSWAQATAIQLCSDKNLAVKKVRSRGGKGCQQVGAGGAVDAAFEGSKEVPGCLCIDPFFSSAPHVLTAHQLAYLTVSLLLEPASELAIMVVATIQADLRSDNFLTGAASSSRSMGSLLG